MVASRCQLADCLLRTPSPPSTPQAKLAELKKSEPTMEHRERMKLVQDAWKVSLPSSMRPQRDSLLTLVCIARWRRASRRSTPFRSKHGPVDAAGREG